MWRDKENDRKQGVVKRKETVRCKGRETERQRDRKRMWRDKESDRKKGVVMKTKETVRCKDRETEE